MSQSSGSFCWGRTRLNSPAQEEDNSHNSYTLTRPRGTRRDGARDKLFSSRESSSLPVKQESAVYSSVWSDTTISLCWIHLVTPKMPSKMYCPHTQSRWWVSKQPQTVSEDLAISLCPYYLKWSTVPLAQAFLQQIYKVTSASETDVYARILFCSLMLFRLTSNYLTH